MLISEEMYEAMLRMGYDLLEMNCTIADREALEYNPVYTKTELTMDEIPY